MADCLFCSIGAGEVPAEKVYEDDQLFAIRDINPVAPLHLLLIPRKHIATILDFEDTDSALVAGIYRLAARLAAENDLSDDGYRVVANCKSDGGQTVYHVHFHLLGGRAMAWPPG
ncbi:MAG: histidine triad nucleotide-binding protein [Deltaproteobacteria bacterium]|jgi:histidine triad (HIT) family protein|nr:histidine triad nucleotide-binding protein [Deltaproteobacteria bacterium]